MSQTTPNIHYVKFMRGSISAWEVLQNTPEKINDDTLYFIYQNAATSRDGKLYLGQKLISGDQAEEISIDNIGDIFIDDEALSDKQILVYNETSQQWENTSLSTIIDTAVGIMQGATENTDGQEGLVPAPSAGDEDKFLKGDGTWSPINIPTFDTDVFTANTNAEITLVDFENASVGTTPVKTSNGIEWVPQINTTINREIITLEDLNDAIEEGTADANTIYMVLNESASDSSNQYDEYMVIQGNLERLGSFGEVNFNDFVTNQVFQTEIGNLNDILNDTIDINTSNLIPGLISRVNTIENSYITEADIGDLSTLILSNGNDNLIEEVNSINNTVSGLSERLQWHELNND